MINIAINGLGRIGRCSLKIALAKKNLRVVAVNDLGDIENFVYLLNHDTVYGRPEKEFKAVGSDIVVGGKKIPFIGVAEPEKLPWKKLNVDVVLECTGVFTTKEDMQRHLKGGAKKVVLSAPAKSEGVATVVMGVNEADAKGEAIVANASCTTNCVAPVMRVLEESFGIEKAMLTTVHSLTATQRLVDSPDKKDWRRGRAAGQNIVPSTTGAAEAVILTMPSLENKFDGLALRVPTLAGSISDIVAVLKKNVTAEQVNKALIKASKSYLKGILGVSEGGMVSSDVLGLSTSTVVDLPLTKVIGGNLVKVLAWYDNEWGYSERLVEMVEYV